MEIKTVAQIIKSFYIIEIEKLSVKRPLIGPDDALRGIVWEVYYQMHRDVNYD